MIRPCDSAFQYMDDVYAIFCKPFKSNRQTIRSFAQRFVVGDYVEIIESLEEGEVGKRGYIRWAVSCPRLIVAVLQMHTRDRFEADPSHQDEL